MDLCWHLLWAECVRPPFALPHSCVEVLTQCGGIWRYELLEAIRIRWGYTGRNWSNGISVLEERDNRELTLSLSVNTHSGGHGFWLQAKRRNLRRKPMLLAPWAWSTQPSWRNKSPSFRPLNMWYFVMAALSD